MATFLRRSNVSTAWAAALRQLAQDGDLVDLVVAIDDPQAEEPVIRAVLDDFIETFPNTRQRLYAVQTVANTIFPQALYNPNVEQARELLYERATASWDVLRRLRANSRGTYFQRLVAWPCKDGTVNQLESAVQRLSSHRNSGRQNGNAYELGVSLPEDIVALPVYAGDRSTMGFPCLSHISLTLHSGRISLAAVYRNHDFMRRAYGNYLGLSRVLQFVARESGFGVGELLCVSTHATIGMSHKQAGPVLRALPEQ